MCLNLVVVIMRNPRCAAAFGRLCVETASNGKGIPLNLAAAFGRLCVETTFRPRTEQSASAAAFGRLCVETFLSRHFHKRFKAAAFGRLCVETVGQVAGAVVAVGSRLRAAVC